MDLETAVTKLRELTLEVVLLDLSFPPRLERDLAGLQQEHIGQIGGYLHGPGQMIIGTSEAMQALYRKIDQVAPTVATVLIRGESGTGKELISQAIHYHSPRRQRLMVIVNCGAIPSELIESELFGHVKGACTGAHRDKKGLFEQAYGRELENVIERAVILNQDGWISVDDIQDHLKEDLPHTPTSLPDLVARYENP